MLRRTAIAILALLLSCAGAGAEPLRVLVAQFTGPGSVGKSMMTTLYFELLRAFDNPGEKGVWILYGKEPLENATYPEAIGRASLSSARADVVVWGDVTPYGDDLVVQSYLAVTPITEGRTVRPEIWRLERDEDSEALQIELGLPGRFYDFEPFRVPANLVQKYSSPDGVPLYSEAKGGKVVGHIDNAFSFLDIQKDAIQVRSMAPDRTTGWIHLTDLYREDIQANAFCQALLRYMRGDWHGARAALEALSVRPDLPNGIRIDSLILLGVAEEKLGTSGVDSFEQAFALNRFDRVSAQYLILGRLSQMRRGQGDGEGSSGLRQAALDLIKRTANLFPPDDPWLRSAKRFAGAE